MCCQFPSKLQRLKITIDFYRGVSQEATTINFSKWLSYTINEERRRYFKLIPRSCQRSLWYIVSHNAHCQGIPSSAFRQFGGKLLTHTSFFYYFVYLDETELNHSKPYRLSNCPVQSVTFGRWQRHTNKADQCALTTSRIVNRTQLTVVASFRCFEVQ